MKINAMLEQHDPSRYTVYQMLDYTKNLRKIRLKQKLMKNIYLFKTEPFVDSLYNYVHVLNEKISKKDLVEIRKFFGQDDFRIKISRSPTLKTFLISNGFKFKDSGNIMVAEDIAKKDYFYMLSKDIRISRVNNTKTLNDYKIIFSESFDCSLDATNSKFGFLDELIVNDNDAHINAFVLYENNIPVSTGAYFAFDNFSIENIGTRKNFRGKGYAHIIIQHLLNEAIKLGYTKACLVASQAGSRVYKKVGFRILTKTATFTR